MTACAPGEDGGLVRIDCLVSKRWVVTVHEEPLEVLERFRERACGSGDTGRLDGLELLADLLEWVLESYFDAFEDIELVLEDIDTTSMAPGDVDSKDEVLGRLVEVRREIGRLRRALTSHREMLLALTRPELEAIASSESAERFSSLRARLDEAVQAARDSRESVVGSFDVLIASTGQRTNDIMKVLTLVSVLILPGTLLAGIMGMNFKLGLFGEEIYFWIVLAAMVVIALATLGIARIRALDLSDRDTMEDVTSRDANASRGGPAPKSALARYLFGLVAISVALVATLLILDAEIGGAEPSYSLLIAAIALTVWYGGFGPSVLAVVFGWGAALWLIVEARGEITLGDNDEMARWGISLAAAVVIAGVAGLLRFRVERSAGEAQSARTAISKIESLQQLSIELSGAPTTADVARVVSAHAPGILSASGMGMGLVEGEELALLDAGSVPPEVRRDGDRLRLEQTTLITEAAREGRVALAADRAAIDAAYGANARLLPAEIQAAMALPLRAQEHVIGSIGFLFDRRDALDDDRQALAGIVADLAAQAFERARLYEVERESRVALERILQVAPRFVSDETPTIRSR